MICGEVLPRYRPAHQSIACPGPARGCIWTRRSEPAGSRGGSS